KLAGEFEEGAARAGRERGKAHLGQKLVGFEGRRKERFKEVGCRKSARARPAADRDLGVECERHRGKFGGRIRVRQAPTKRPSKPHLSVPDERHSLGKEWH